MARNISVLLNASSKLCLAPVAALVASWSGLGEPACAAGVRHHAAAYIAQAGHGAGKHGLSRKAQRSVKAFSMPLGNGTFYHGRPVMPGVINIYYIWYGSWDSTTDTTQAMLTNFAQHFGGTPYFNKTYDGVTNTTVSGLANFGGATYDLGSQGTVLTDGATQRIIANALASHALPVDPNGAYFVLASKDIKQSPGFCTQSCGWHTYGGTRNKSVNYSFLGGVQQCASACSAESSDFGAGAMTNIIAHELAGSASDPNLNPWFDKRREGGADKCAWTYGPTKVLPNGAHYNVTWVDQTLRQPTNWLPQYNWQNPSGGACALPN